MYSIMLIGNKILKKETLGGGDIKLMFVFGIILGPILGLFSIFIGSVIALPVSIFMLKKEYGYVTLVFGTVGAGKTTALVKDALETKEDNTVFLSLEVPQPKIYDRIAKLGYDLSKIKFNVIDPKCYDITNHLINIIKFYETKVLYVDQYTLLGNKDSILKLSELAHDLNISIICSCTFLIYFITFFISV
jgi:hypothetical protein